MVRYYDFDVPTRSRNFIYIYTRCNRHEDHIYIIVVHIYLKRNELGVYIVYGNPECYGNPDYCIR